MKFSKIKLTAALLALSYLIPVVRIFFSGKVTSPVLQKGGEASKAMLIPIVITAVVSFILGVMPNAVAHLYDFASMAAEAIAQGGGPIA